MSHFSSRLLALGFVTATAFGLGGCSTTTVTRADGSTVSTTSIDPCLGKTVGGAVTGAVLGAAIGDTRHSAVNVSVAGGVLGAGQGCNGQQRQVEYRRAPQPAVTYINTGIRITKVDCLASGGVWGQDTNGANVCVGQSQIQIQNHHHRPVVNRDMCLYKLGWEEGGGGTPEGLKNNQFSAPRPAGNKNLGRWAPGMAIPAGHAAKTC